MMVRTDIFYQLHPEQEIFATILFAQGQILSKYWLGASFWPMVEMCSGLCGLAICKELPLLIVRSVYTAEIKFISVTKSSSVEIESQRRAIVIA